MAISVRALESRDRPAWSLLWKGYLTFYRAPHDATVEETTWRRLLDPDEKMYAIGAFEGSTLLGIAHYLFHRSTWTVGPYCYLQDLFTVEGARRQGVGSRLIGATKEHAQTEGATRVYWLTHSDNEVGRKLYDKVADCTGFIQYRIAL